MKTTIFTEHKLFSGSNFLYEGMKELGYDVSFCSIHNTNPYNYGRNEIQSEIISGKKGIKPQLEEADTIVIAATSPLDWIRGTFGSWDILKSKKVKIVIGDSYYVNNHVRMNEIFEECSIEVFIMPDIMKWCTVDCKPYYPPCIPIENNVPYKMDPFTITHLPGGKGSMELKGTGKIKDLVGNVKSKIPKVVYETRGILNWEQIIDLKKNTTLYVDQLVKNNNTAKPNRFGKIEYDGGLGKNGIEAMMLGIPTITSGNDIQDGLPMMWVDPENFEEVVCTLIENEKLLLNYRKRQQEWALANCTHTAVAKYVMEGK